MKRTSVWQDQFIHYQAYARQGTESKRSLIPIAQEADRDSGSHPHVITPQPPGYLLGTYFVDAAEQIIAAADESRVIHGGKGTSCVRMLSRHWPDRQLPVIAKRPAHSIRSGSPPHYQGGKGLGRGCGHVRAG